MNVRPGDVAMFTSDAQAFHDGVPFTVNRGTFVYVLGCNWSLTVKRRRVFWKVEPFKVTSNGGMYRATISSVSDRVLKPIRPDDGEDEMLRIAGKPARRVDFPSGLVVWP